MKSRYLPGSPPNVSGSFAFRLLLFWVPKDRLVTEELLGLGEAFDEDMMLSMVKASSWVVSISVSSGSGELDREVEAEDVADVPVLISSVTQSSRVVKVLWGKPPEEN